MKRGLLLLAVVMLAIGLFAQNVTVSGRVVVAMSDKRHNGPTSAQNVVVWLTPARKESATAGPPQHVRLVQKNKTFEPHLSVVPVGSTIDFENHDPFFHNVFSLFDGRRFDLGLYEAGGTRAVRLDRPGISYIFCNIHSEMSAVVLALSTPFYGISSAKGEVTIHDVPPGAYLVHVWYEASSADTLNQLTREIEVTDDRRSLGTIRVVAENALPHKNKYGRDYDDPSPDSPLYNH